MAGFLDIRAEGGCTLWRLDKGRITREVATFEADRTGRLSAQTLPSDVGETIVSLPLEWLDFRVVDVALDDEKKAREALPYALEGLVMSEPQGLAIESIVLERASAGGLRVLAAFCPKALPAALMESLGAHGIETRAITSLELGALARRHSAGELEQALLEQVELSSVERSQAAMREASGPTINLKRGELTQARDVQRLERSMVLWGALLCALLLVLAGDFYIKALTLKKSLAGVQASTQQLASQMLPNEKPSPAMGYKIKSKLQELRKNDAALQGVDPLEAMAFIERAMPKDLTVSELVMEPQFVSIKGEGPDLGSLDKARSELSAKLADLKVSSQGKGVSGKDTFSITAKWVEIK